MKLKAGALQYVIFISVVIALLVLAFIALTYTQQQFKSNANFYKEAVRNADLAIKYASKQEIPFNRLTPLNLTENTSTNTTIERIRWGVFEVIKSNSGIKNQKFNKIALLGGAIANRTSLYVQDNNQPLVVVGSTRIEGNTKLPKQGLKRGTIAGNSYMGDRLLYGSATISQPNLPKIKNEPSIKQLCYGNFEFSSAEEFDLVEGVKVLNSFSQPTKILKNSGFISLSDITLTGNIVVQSSTAIRISASASLTDVILIAPKIEILNEVKGNFQAFATKEIIVGENCKLKYPSALTIFEKPLNEEVLAQSNIQNVNMIGVAKNSEIKGIVNFLTDSKENLFKTQILLEENASIIGEVYCNGNFELKGNVSGSVITKGFNANQFGSVYQNHIYNGKILAQNFPDQYVGLFLESNNKKVVKWLY